MCATSTMISTTTTTIATPISATTALIPLILVLAFRIDLGGARMAPW